MSEFAAIDLSRLPSPDIIERLDAEAIIAEAKAQVLALAPELSTVLALESEPVVKLIEVFAYREVLLRARINDASRAVLLPTATGADLDNLAALFGVQRLMVTAANPAAVPPTSAVYETDTALRRRSQLALEGFSTAGPRGAYIYHALSAHADIGDVAVASSTPGTVEVTVMRKAGNGAATASILAAVTAALNDEDVRPLCDTVVVQSCLVKLFTVNASLVMFDGPDPAVVLAAATAALNDYIASCHRIGAAVRLSGIYGALHQPGLVSQVNLTAPLADVIPTATQVTFCAAPVVVIAP
jgi:phage-related baseplate assembly protein